MKIIFLFICSLLLAVPQTQAADLNPINAADNLLSSRFNPIVMLKTVKSKVIAFSKEIKVQTQEYDEVKIKNVYLQHDIKSKKTGKADILVVKGTIKNASNRNISDVKILAIFKDDSGQVLSKQIVSTTPEIIKNRGAKKAYFSVEVMYQENIAECILDVSWAGKENIY